MIRADLHVHTVYSSDSLTPLSVVEEFVFRRGLEALAITDHNTIEGALMLRQRAPFVVIVGEEIHSNQGEIIGLFLQEPIPPALSPAETVRLIHEQGGLVCIPHPMDRVRSSAISPEALEDNAPEVDIVEVLNARITFPGDNRLAEAWARWHDVCQSAGSDAHHATEIGRAWVEMPSFSDPETFLAALRVGTIHGTVSPPFMHLSSTYARVAKGLRGEPIASR